MGHIMRCLSLAQVLRDVHRCRVSFWMNQDDIGISWVKQAGWPVALVAQGEMMASGDAGHIHGLIVDLPGGASAEEIRALRDAHPGVVILLMDGTGTGRLTADLVVAPIDRQPEASTWAGFRGERCAGPAYAILDLAYLDVPKRVRVERVPRILVAMGGSDPHGLTLQALRALDRMPEAMEFVVAVGPAFLHEAELQGWLLTGHHASTIAREPSLLKLMVSSDVAVVSFGTTVYELAATGLPAIALSISEDHLEAADIFARFGSMTSLGLFSSVEDETVQGAIRRVLNDRALWQSMAERGQSTVDGKGAERVAERLVARIYNQWESRADG
jgi:spore coat polysaccharide biosynthesis protein SpsF